MKIEKEKTEYWLREIGDNDKEIVLKVWITETKLISVYPVKLKNNIEFSTEVNLVIKELKPKDIEALAKILLEVSKL